MSSKIGEIFCCCCFYQTNNAFLLPRKERGLINMAHSFSALIYPFFITTLIKSCYSPNLFTRLSVGKLRWDNIRAGGGDLYGIFFYFGGKIAKKNFDETYSFLKNLKNV